MRLQSLNMKSVYAALCCFHIFSCETGFTDSLSTTERLDDDFALLPSSESITENDLNQTFTDLSLKLIQDISDKLNQSKSGLENSDNKINETELYENGQTIKENNERSFIFINQKFKSPWFDSHRSLSRKSLFSGHESSDHFDDVANKFSVGFESVENIVNYYRQTEKPEVQNHLKSVANKNPPHKNPSKNLHKAAITSSYKQNKAFYNPVLVVPTHTEDNREYVELLKRPLVRPVAISGNARTNILYPDKESNGPYEKRTLERHFFNDDEDSVVPRLAVQNQQHVQTKFNYAAPFPQQWVPSSLVGSTRVDNSRNIFDFKFNFDTTNKISESYEEDKKFDQYLKSTLRGETSFGKFNENTYDCYNSSCKRLSNKHNMQRLNNGVLLGLNCVCHDGSTKDRSSRKNSETSKEVAVPNTNSTEVNDYDEKVKEAVNFNNVNDQSDVKVAHSNNVNKTGCFYSGWYKPKCNNNNS